MNSLVFRDFCIAVTATFRVLYVFVVMEHGDYEKTEGLYDAAHCPNRLSEIFSDNNIIRLVQIFAPYGLSI